MSVVDLFCGCGGLSKGFEYAGFNIVAAYDGWDKAVKCYNDNFMHQAFQLDLSNVEESVKSIAKWHPDTIIGGPPCQEFSNAGKRQEGERADLTYRFAEIVTKIKPSYFVMENVPRAKDSAAYARARALYKENNYGLTEVVLDASRCGVPQKRSRFFCIGAYNASDDFLLESFFEAYGDEKITVRDYFKEQGVDLEIDNFYRHPTTYSRRAVFSVDDASPTIRGVNRPKPPTYNRHEKDSVEESELASIRALTLRERATIQTFPIDFSFDNPDISKGEFEQMVGNAVPVLLAKFVAERLYNYMMQSDDNQRLVDDSRDFAWWLRNVKRYESDRSISDVFSRIRRAQRILPSQRIDRYYIVDLEQTKEYKGLTVSVRSQIKKAINLKIAYNEWVLNHE